MPRSESSGGIVDPPIPGDMTEVDDLEVVFEPLPDELSLHADVEGMTHGEAADDLEMDLPDRPGDRAAHGSHRSHNDHDSDDERGEKSSVRDIMTWKDAIGMIIEGNLQTRAKSPQSSHPPRGGSRGRGRGRGRGGHHR
jgi:hypothetical protein